MRHARRRRLRRTATRTTRVLVPLTAGLLAASSLTASPAQADDAIAPEAPPVVDPGPEVPATLDPSPAPLDPSPAPTAISGVALPETIGLPAAEVPVPEPVLDPATKKQIAREQRERRLRAAVVALARKQVGDRYIAGRTGPDAFDCSGLVRYVIGKITGDWLPHYSRTQYHTVDRISLKHARPGDLVFYLSRGAHHVGIYIGSGRMVHAANPRSGVRIGPIGGPWYSRTFTGIGRVIPAA